MQKYILAFEIEDFQPKAGEEFHNLKYQQFEISQTLCGWERPFFN